MMGKLTNPAFDYAVLDKDEAAKLRYFEGLFPHQQDFRDRASGNG